VDGKADEMDNQRCLQIADRLIAKGMAVLNAPRKTILFVDKDEAANRILNDIESYPHIFVLCCIADRQVPTAVASRATYDWCRQVVPEGSLTFDAIQDSIQRAQREGRIIQADRHLLPDITHHFYAAVSKIHACYGGHAEQIWQGNPVAVTVVRRFCEFDGVNQKIANMAAHTLLRDFKVRLQKKQTIDIPVDGNVKRVFKRLELTPQDARGDKEENLVI
jgi:hypothetical protein